MTWQVVLFRLVAYGNIDEVDGFIDHLRNDHAQRGVGEVRFAISANHSTSQPSANAGQPDVVVVTRPDNPGYLDGGRAALAAAEARWPDSADWVILTNADLELRGATLTEVLATHDPARPAVLAPRITEGPENVEKNPHVLSPRTPSRLRLNHWLTMTPTVARGYLLASRARFGLRTRGDQPANGRGPAPAGTLMHSPYGAMMIFSRGFLQTVGLPAGVPLLAEEWAIAEAARKAGAPVAFEPQAHVHHTAHTTTGGKISTARARMLTVAFAYIARQAHTP